MAIDILLVFKKMNVDNYRVEKLFDTTLPSCLITNHRFYLLRILTTEFVSSL